MWRQKLTKINFGNVILIGSIAILILWLLIAVSFLMLPSREFRCLCSSMNNTEFGSGMPNTWTCSTVMIGGSLGTSGFPAHVRLGSMSSGVVRISDLIRRVGASICNPDVLTEVASLRMPWSSPLPSPAAKAAAGEGVCMYSFLYNIHTLTAEGVSSVKLEGSDDV